MSTTNAAITLSLGAVLGAGWVKTFSSGKKNLLDFRWLFSNLDKQIKDVSISGEKYFHHLDVFGHGKRSADEGEASIK